MPAFATSMSAASSVVGRQAQDEPLASDPEPEQRPGVLEGRWRGHRGAGRRSGRGRRRSMVARRYTQSMGAVETMEEFFEKLNGGDREGAVALMDEMTEMRVHVGDSVQTLRGVERVGGWFLRGDSGLRMIPGEIRDTGNTYEADLLVVRPGAPTQHIDATFRVEAGQDHRDQHRAPLAIRRRPASYGAVRLRGLLVRRARLGGARVGELVGDRRPG